MEIKSYLVEKIHQAVKKLAEIDNLEIPIEIPRDTSHGDFATNVSMQLARQLKQNPRKIAEEIIKNISDTDQVIQSTEIAGPGFINFKLNPNFLQKLVREIVEQDKNFGKSSKSHPKSILVEFVSANPTGPVNIVSARAGAVGNALVNLFKWSGDRVNSEFYVNDSGVQVDNLALSVDIRYRELLGESVELPEEAYHGEYIIDIAREILDKKGPSYFLNSDEDRLEIFKEFALEKMIALQKKDLSDFRVTFDRWFHESKIRASGNIRKVIDSFLGFGLIYDYDGCLWFKSTEFGDDEDRVVIKSDGQPTYFLPDIAYHLNKYERGFEFLIDIWGPDHHGYIPRMSAALAALGYRKDQFEVLISQQVNLYKDGVVVKMSKRAGMIVTLRELIEEVGADVARYFMIRRKLSSHLDFDLDLAKKESDDNPVYYVQYAHARISSVLKNAQEKNIQFPPLDQIAVDLLNEPEEITLIKQLVQFPDLIISAAIAREPHRIPLFLESVAATYHQFYHNHRIVTDDVKLTEARLLLSRATQIVIHNGLNLLGVSAPEKM